MFELGGALAPALPELAVGPWRRAPGLVAFDTGPLESVWRVGLASDLAASRTALADGERSVARTHAALDDAPRRLERALEQLLPDLPPAARSDPADADLAGSRASSPGSEARDAASSLRFASPPESRLAWSSADREASRVPGEPGWLGGALDRIADLARGRARIETRVDGALVAHSLMTLSGDTQVWAVPRLSLAGAQLHARSVAIAVRTRHAWARILTLVVRGGARIAALGLPAAAIAALPVAWRIVRDALREANDRRTDPA